MSSYESFASVYDLFMDNVPYELWSQNILGILKEYHVTQGLVADLGCGTGIITRKLADAGYDMIGIDNSYDMLGIAMEENSQGILYLCQDMRSFELYGTVAAIVSVCDSMNYITEKDDLVSVFSLVNNYLDPKGLFLFDMNTPYKYEHILGDNTFAENREEGSFIWENAYDCKSRMNAYDLTLYIQEEDGVYARFEEEHFQKAYSLEEVKEALQLGGLEFINAWDVDTMGPLEEHTERMYILARECGK